MIDQLCKRKKVADTASLLKFSPAGWYAKIGEATLADAILDRIVHDSYTIEIQKPTFSIVIYHYTVRG
ncbi:MAG: ATP-binding protein [Syntrophomonadaceae bacterium]